MSPETSPINHEEAPKPKKRKKKMEKAYFKEPSTEVQESLAEIQKMEQERVAEETAKKQTGMAEEDAAKLDPEKRFKKGVEKLREANLKALEAKRREEEDRLIEEAREELRKKYEARESAKRDEGVEVEITVEEPVTRDLATASRQEVENDLQTLQWFVDPEQKKVAINERMAAHHRAEKLLTKEQLSGLAQNPLELSFFTSGEDPITLSNRAALQEEIDMASEAQGYSVDFSDWMELEKDLRSMEEGGKQVPMIMETAKERAQALYKFETELRRSRLSAIDRAHEEFPDSFTFSSQDFENLLKQVAALEMIVKKEKKNRNWKEKFKRVFAGPSQMETELSKAKAELQDWDEKIADFVDVGKSKLAFKFLLDKKHELKRLEAQALKFLTK